MKLGAATGIGSSWRAPVSAIHVGPLDSAGRVTDPRASQWPSLSRRGWGRRRRRQWALHQSARGGARCTRHQDRGRVQARARERDGEVRRKPDAVGRARRSPAISISARRPRRPPRRARRAPRRCSGRPSRRAAIRRISALISTSIQPAASRRWRATASPRSAQPRPRRRRRARPASGPRSPRSPRRRRRPPSWPGRSCRPARHQAVLELGRRVPGDRGGRSRVGKTISTVVRGPKDWELIGFVKP